MVTERARMAGNGVADAAEDKIQRETLLDCSSILSYVSAMLQSKG